MTLLRTSFPVGLLGCTCSLVACPATGEALVIDPGDEAPRILAVLAERGWRAVQVVHTHAHFDHVLGTADVARATGAETAMHREDRFLVERVSDQLSAFGLSHPGAGPERLASVPMRQLEGGEVLTFGKREVQVIHTPGHTPGSVCLYIEGRAPGPAAPDRPGRARAAEGREPPLLFAGDTLFAGGVGRTDLWGGSWESLVRSIRGPLFALPDDTLVIPGHGPETSIAREREQNRFVGDRHSPPAG